MATPKHGPTVRPFQYDLCLFSHLQLHPSGKMEEYQEEDAIVSSFSYLFTYILWEYMFASRFYNLFGFISVYFEFSFQPFEPVEFLKE